MHEAGLHIHANHHAEPDKIDPEFGGDRREKRNDDERDLKEIEKERQEENKNINDNQETQLTARQPG